MVLLMPVMSGNFDYLPLALLAILPAFVAGAIFYGGGSVLFGVQTAVQSVRIDGLNSRRKAKKARKLLTAEIERVQGVLTEPALQAATRSESPKEDLNPSVNQPDTNVRMPPAYKSLEEMYPGKE